MKLAETSGVEYVLGLFVKRPAITYPSVEEARRRGYPVHVLPEFVRYDPSVILRAVRLARANQVSLVQSHGYKPALVAWGLQRRLKLPWVAFCHGSTDENWRVRLYHRLDRALTRRADRLVVMSEVMQEAYTTAGVDPWRVRVVHNAVDPEEFRPIGQSEVYRSRCDAAPTDFLMGVIGRLSPEKGQEVLIEAMAQLHASSGIKAVLIGEGVTEGRLRELVSARGLTGRVHFLGYTDNIGDLYHALDLVVIPSLSEGLPNVLLEAMLHRRPVVATTVGAIPEVMTGHLAQMLVPPGDATALARVIVKVQQDENVRTQVIERVDQLVRERFSPRRRLHEIVKIYEELLGR